MQRYPNTHFVGGETILDMKTLFRRTIRKTFLMTECRLEITCSCESCVFRWSPSNFEFYRFKVKTENKQLYDCLVFRLLIRQEVLVRDPIFENQLVLYERFYGKFLEGTMNLRYNTKMLSLCQIQQIVFLRTLYFFSDLRTTLEGTTFVNLRPMVGRHD